MKKYLAVLALSFPFVAQAVAEAFLFSPTGELAVGPLNLRLVVFDPKLNRTETEKGFQVIESGDAPEGSFREGVFHFRGNTAPPFRLCSVFRLNEATLDSGELCHTLWTGGLSLIETGVVGMDLELPETVENEAVITLDGQKIDWGNTENPPWFSTPREVGEIRIVTAEETIKLIGPFQCTLHDGRKFRRPIFQIRLLASPWQGAFKQARLKASISYSKAPYNNLSFSNAANATLADDVAGDGLGGWTDQGPDRDLRIFPTGEGNWKGVPWFVADAKSGNQIIALRGPGSSHNPDQISIDLPSEIVGTLFLLHSSAWTPSGEEEIGRVILVDEDGNEHSRPVRTLKEVGDWVGGRHLSNGVVAWNGLTSTSRASVFLSAFNFPAVRARTLRFESTGKAQWLILAGTASPEAGRPLPKEPTEKPWIATANDEWHALDFGLEVEAGSALDFSHLTEAPAGQYGRVLVKGDQFVFEKKPGHPVRFFGANLVFGATWPEKAEADRLALRLRRLGYNAIRLHHTDRELYPSDSDTIRADVLDRIHYLVAALKRNGLYLSVDIYSARVFSEKQLPLQKGTTRRIAKELFPVDETAMTLWQQVADEYLLAPNPYTGIPLGLDPALMGICLVNEDHIVVGWDRDPNVANIYRERFDSWKTGDGSAFYLANKRVTAFRRFLVERQNVGYQAMISYLRQHGVQAPLSGANYGDDVAMSWIRGKLDYTDNHLYWDHRKMIAGNGKLPYSFMGGSVLALEAKTPRELFPTRTMGRPFVVTEFNYCYPNDHRAEGGPVMGAYAGLQGWNGLFRFAYSSGARDGVFRIEQMRDFDVANDPIALLSDRIIALQFLRGDVASAPSSIVFDLCSADPEESHGGSYPHYFSRLGLVTRIGTTMQNPQEDSLLSEIIITRLPATMDDSISLADRLKKKAPSVVFDPGDGHYTSETGQISLDREHEEFSSITSRSEAFVIGGERKFEGKFAIVENLHSEPATVAILSLDEKILSKSHRLLLLHLTDGKATGARFSNADKRILESWGSLPYLVRGGAVRLQLGLSGQGWRLYALNLDGTRSGERTLEVTAEGLTTATLNVNADKQPTLCYELVRDSAN